MGELPIPPHFDPSRVGEIWRVPYERRALEAEEWARRHRIRPAADDHVRVCLVAVDVQNTFCHPDFELFVAGRSGRGAVEDNVRLCQFLYRNLDRITQIVPTLDTHQALQIFHAVALVDGEGRHPAPYTLVSADDVERGRWRLSPAFLRRVGLDEAEGAAYLRHYVRRLAESGKYELTVWPFHALLGGLGHALVSAVEEAIFFHTVARESQPEFQIKGSNPLTEHYSALGPEVTEGPDGRTIASRNVELVETLLGFDAVVVAGQAKSHCVAWTIDDLLAGAGARAELAHKVYLLEDCTSPVVVPGADYTEQADAAFRRFADAGMHVVRSTQPITSWPGLAERLAAPEARSC
jgi:nicotinamidase-related amidase